jgi:hypothetical protein
MLSTSQEGCIPTRDQRHRAEHAWGRGHDVGAPTKPDRLHLDHLALGRREDAVGRAAAERMGAGEEAEGR